MLGTDARTYPLIISIAITPTHKSEGVRKEKDCPRQILSSFVPRTMKSLGRLSLLALSFCVPVLSTQPFHHRVSHQGAANNKEFHKHLVEQLAKSRQNATTLVEDISEESNNKDGLRLVSANSSLSLAALDATSMQVYLPQYLPTSPSPPSTCASALTASVSCNSTITLMA